MPRLRFPYLPVPGGPREILRPVLPLEIVVPGLLIPAPFLGVVDTGAPFSMFPRYLAEYLGLRIGRARRIGVAVMGWSGRAPLVEGFFLRLTGSDASDPGRAVRVEVRAAALLVTIPMFESFGLLGQVGFLDRLEEVCVREHEKACEISVRERRPPEGRGGEASVVRERPPRWRRRSRRGR